MIDIKKILEYSYNLRVLYVEDDEECRNDTLDVLKHFFKDIDVATNGEEALRLYRKYYNYAKRYYDIVITDDSFLQNFYEISILIDIYKYLSPKNLKEIFNLHNDNQNFNLDSLEILNDEFNLIYTFFNFLHKYIKSDFLNTYKEFIFYHLSSGPKFKTYLENVYGLINNKTKSPILDQDTITSWVNYIINLKIIADATLNNSDLPYKDELSKYILLWIQNLLMFESPKLFTKYINNDELTDNELYILTDLYLKFRKDTPGYYDYYENRNINNDSIMDYFIKLIDKIDPLKNILGNK
jgi:hypothetical protein